MRCSACSKVVRPIVACDIDGTLADYHTHFLRFAEVYLGRRNAGVFELDVYDGRENFARWCMRHLSITLEQFRTIKLAYRQGAQKRSMPMLLDAQRFCQSVREAGAELWLTTTRPYLSLDNVIPDTEFWLSRHEIRFDGLLFDADKYQVLAERVDPDRVVAVFDDLDEFLQGAEAHFPGRTWLVRGLYNRMVPWHRMAHGLSDARAIALDQISTWKEQHEDS